MYVCARQKYEKLSKKLQKKQKSSIKVKQKVIKIYKKTRLRRLQDFEIFTLRLLKLQDLTK